MYNSIKQSQSCIQYEYSFWFLFRNNGHTYNFRRMEFRNNMFEFLTELFFQAFQNMLQILLVLLDDTERENKGSNVKI